MEKNMIEIDEVQKNEVVEPTDSQLSEFVTRNQMLKQEKANQLFQDFIRELNKQGFTLSVDQLWRNGIPGPCNIQIIKINS
jgi:hypothetical protein